MVDDGTERQRRWYKKQKTPGIIFKAEIEETGEWWVGFTHSSLKKRAQQEKTRTNKEVKLTLLEEVGRRYSIQERTKWWREKLGNSV